MGRSPQSCGCQHGRVQRLIVNGRYHARGPRGAKGSGGPPGEWKGRDCRTEKVQRVAQDAPRWPELNTKDEKWVGGTAVLNTATECPPTCYPGLVEAHWGAGR